MTRPTKSGLDYFPHDTDACNDDKIEQMRALYGNDGYAFYFIMLERIYKTNDCSIDLSTETSVKLYAKITGLRVDKFKKVLRSSIEVGCFDKEVFNNSQRVTSNAIIKRAKIVFDSREYNRKYYYKKQGVS